MVLAFHLAKVVKREGKNSAQLSLRFKQGAEADGLTASEPLLAAFAFPFGPEAVVPKERIASEEYTFTLTHGDGSRFQGFCRLVLPPAPRLGSKLRYPWVLCMVSKYPWSSFYFTVLQTIEQLLRLDESLDTDLPQLPAGCQALTFLEDLAFQLDPDPEPGAIIRVPLPNASKVLGTSPSATLQNRGTSLYNDDWIQLQVPADCGNGKRNCGIGLARLLWNIPVPGMLTLIAAMLLERRVVMTSRSRDTLTASVQAAAAMLYPFQYHHIFLPLLPKMLSDYLQAPMPFLVGLPDQMLGILRGMQGMEEVTLVDLDQGKVYSNWLPGSAGASPTVRDDASQLPWREELEAALSTAYRQLKSPTEYESSPFIASIMQEYFLKLLGNYRSFVHEDTPALNARFAAALHLSVGAGQGSGGAGGAAAGFGSGSGAASPASPTPTPRPSARVASRLDLAADNTIRGSGYVFEHAAFVAHHRHSESARAFLSAFRHSQMYEVWVQERLALASHGYETEDPFEMRLVSYQERRWRRSCASSTARQAAGSAASMAAPQGRLASMFRKHRRTGSGESAAVLATPSMRRITTDPVLQGQNSLPMLPDPASFFDCERELEPLPDWSGAEHAHHLHNPQVGQPRPSSGRYGTLGKTSVPIIGTTTEQSERNSVATGAAAASSATTSPLPSQSASGSMQQQAYGRRVSTPAEALNATAAGPSVPSGLSQSRPEPAHQHHGPDATDRASPTFSSPSSAPAPGAAAGAALGTAEQTTGASPSAASDVGGRALAATLQTSKKTLEGAKDAVKDLWSQATQGMKKSIGSPGPSVPARPASTSGLIEAGTTSDGDVRTSNQGGLLGLRAGKAGGPPVGSGLLQRYLPQGAGGVMQSLLEGSKLKQPPAPVRPLSATSQGQPSQQVPLAAPAVEPAPQGGWDPFNLSRGR